MIRCLNIFIVLLLAPYLRADHIVIDDVGRKVAVREHPHRVIALVPSVADILFSLGHGANVAGVSEYSRYPAAARAKPRIGLPLSPNVETILSLHPDLVIGIVGLNDSQVIGNLERVHLAVVMVNGGDVAKIYRSIETIGTAMNDAGAARALNSRLQMRVERVIADRKDKPRPTVLFPIWSDPLIVAGKHAFVTELITMAGGDSVTADASEDWPQISVETVVKKQPAILILPASWKVTLAQLGQLAGWKDLECLRRNRVIRVDDRLELPSPVAFDAMEDLAKQFDAVSAQ